MTAISSNTVYRIILESEKSVIRFGIAQRSFLAKDGDWICVADGVNIYRHYYPKKRDNTHSTSIVKVLAYCISKIPGISEDDLKLCLSQFKKIEGMTGIFKELNTVTEGELGEHKELNMKGSLWDQYAYSGMDNIIFREERYLAHALEYEKIKEEVQVVNNLLQTKYNISLTQPLAKLKDKEINLNWLEEIIFPKSFVKYSQVIIENNKYFSSQVKVLDNSDVNQGFFNLFGQTLTGFNKEQTYFLPLYLHSNLESKAPLFNVRGILKNELDFNDLSGQMFCLSLDSFKNLMASDQIEEIDNTILVKIENAMITGITPQDNMSEALIPEVEKMQVILEKKRVNNHLNSVEIGHIRKKVVDKV